MSVKYPRQCVFGSKLEGHMSVVKFVLQLLGWLVTVVLQGIASYFFILIFNIIFAGVDSTSRLGWLESLFVIWLGYIIGINLVGSAALRWVWKGVRPLTIQRLIGTAIGALIPMLILLPIGFSVPVGDTGTSFFDLVTNNWQPILALASLLIGIVGFYVPGMINPPSPQKQGNA